MLRLCPLDQLVVPLPPKEMSGRAKIIPNVMQDFLAVYVCPRIMHTIKSSGFRTLFFLSALHPLSLAIFLGVYRFAQPNTGIASLANKKVCHPSYNGNPMNMCARPGKRLYNELEHHHV